MPSLGTVDDEEENLTEKIPNWRKSKFELDCFILKVFVQTEMEENIEDALFFRCT